MTIMRWRNYPSLSDVFESLFDRQAENMENETYHISPAINILEHEKGFVIELAAPGFSKEDLKISLDSNVLTISAEGKKDQEKVQYLRREFACGKFSKSFTLPKSIDIEKISADFDKGILRVNLPKKEELTITKQIKIQ